MLQRVLFGLLLILCVACADQQTAAPESAPVTYPHTLGTIRTFEIVLHRPADELELSVVCTTPAPWGKIEVDAQTFQGTSFTEQTLQAAATECPGNAAIIFNTSLGHTSILPANSEIDITVTMKFPDGAESLQELHRLSR